MRARNAAYADQKGIDLKRGDYPGVPCHPHAKSCTEHNAEARAWRIHFRDDEIAKRFARALMHAAILCTAARNPVRPILRRRAEFKMKSGVIRVVFLAALAIPGIFAERLAAGQSGGDEERWHVGERKPGPPQHD